MINKRALTILLSFIALAFVTSCGFQLRGAVNLIASPQSVYVSVQGQQGILKRQLSLSLHANGIKLSSTSQDVVALAVEKQVFSRRVITVDRRGRALEYGLTLYVKVSYKSSDGVDLVDPFGLQLERDFSYSDEQAVGKTGEEEQIKEAMYKDMVQLILRRLETQKNNAG